MGSGGPSNGGIEDGGVSRGHSTAEVKAGRPEPVECSSTTGPQPATATPYGRVEGLEDLDGRHGRPQADLLEQILSRENMFLAWKRVKTNKGAAGMDGMSTEAFPEFARQHWERIRSALEKGAHRPAAVLRVRIPKSTGGQRPLGIPTVLDRVIQQAKKLLRHGQSWSADEPVGSTTSATATAMLNWSNWISGCADGYGCATGNSGNGPAPDGDTCWPLAFRATRSNSPRAAAKGTGGWRAIASSNAR